MMALLALDESPAVGNGGLSSALSINWSAICSNSTMRGETMGQQPIQVKAGEAFEIPLEGSASTGFRWELASSAATKRLVKLVDEDREATSTVPGGRTVQHFRFQARVPGKLQLTFHYRRSWEAPDSGTVQTVDVQIDPAD
jgi:predicted secreted protein